ncbi:MAG: NPXTG-anchored protein, partial [Oscillospiraceae bacterium]|nr:NPXTG-anchored protein [Oscillospiraceae bacterium]
KVTAIKFTMECPNSTTANDKGELPWFGGAFGIQSKENSWNTKQWCVNEENEDKVVATKIDDNTYEVTWELSIAAADDEYLHAVWQNYDKGASKLKSVTLVGLDEVSEAPADTTAAPAATTTEEKKDDKATTTTSGSKTNATSGNKTDGAKTGDAGVGIAVAALSLAGAAAVVARKKH